MATWFRVAVSVSLLGHAGVLAWLGHSRGTFVSSTFDAPSIAVEPGHAAIELMASTASAAAEEPPEWTVRLPKRTEAETARPLAEPADEPERLAAAMPPLVRDAAPDELRPHRPVKVPAAEPRPAGETSVELPRRPHEPPPPDVLDETAELPMKLARREKELPTETSVASVPQVAQKASQGAEAKRHAPVYNPAPVYPSEALKARRNGVVELRIEIAPNGTVLRASVHRASGVASLDAAALGAVRRWRFEPASGEAIRTAYHRFHFVIETSTSRTSGR
jgi:protein TonB